MNHRLMGLLTRGVVRALGLSWQATPTLAQGKEYTFGAVLPLTGGLSESYGVPVRNAIGMAVEEVNAANVGFTLKAEFCDHGGEAQKGVQCANQLVNAFQVPFINTNF